MKNCTSCGMEINDSAKFCKFCGTAQSEPAVVENTTNNLYSMPIYEAPVVEEKVTTSNKGKSIVSYVLVLIASFLSIGLMFAPLAIYGHEKITLIKMFNNIDSYIDILKRCVSMDTRFYALQIMHFSLMFAVMAVCVIIALYAFISIIVAIANMCNSKENTRFAISQLKGLGSLYLLLAFVSAIPFIQTTPGMAFYVIPGVVLLFLIITMIMFVGDKNRTDTVFSIMHMAISLTVAMLVIAPVMVVEGTKASAGIFARAIFAEEPGRHIATYAILTIIFLINSFAFGGSIRKYKRDENVSSGMIFTGITNTALGIAALVLITTIEEVSAKIGFAVIVYIAIGVVEIGLGILRKCINK